MGRRSLVIFSVVGALVAVPACGAARSASPARQAEVERKGAHVMPFDQSSTMHVFEPSASGGREMIVVHDGDPRQVRLVRAHLRHEAAAFRRGDYTDPARIHGAVMPGLRELSRAAGRVRVDYADTGAGASLTFRARDPGLVRALHRWFAAQTADHGRHASMRM